MFDMRGLMPKAHAPPFDTRQRPVLAAVCLAAIVLPLSFSGGAVATPAIGRDLGGSPVALTWVTNAFMLSFGGCLMTAGALADRFGRKRVFSLGIAAFAAISLMLAFAPSVLVLDILRAAQGVAAAAALSGGTAGLAQEFDSHTRTRAFSLLGTTFGVGLAFGPLLAGVLIQSFGWRSIFLSTAAVAALALLFGTSRMRETRDPDAVRLDWPGALTFTGALSLFTLGVIQAPESGWSSPSMIGVLTGAGALAAAFIVIETRTARPILDLSLFRYPRFVGVQVLPVATCYCYVVLLVLLPLRFIGIEGRREVEAGLLMLSLSAPMLFAPVLAAMLTRCFSAGVVSGAGLLIAGAGLLWLAQIAPGAPDQTTVLPMLMIGFGAGLPWGLMDGLSVSVVPKERAGMATGIFGTVRVAGEGIALAVVSAILIALTQHGLRSAYPVADATLSARIAQGAQRLATGDLDQAAAFLPDIGRPMLTQLYMDAFRAMLHVLAALTLLSALTIFAALGRTEPPQASDPGL